MMSVTTDIRTGNLLSITMLVLAAAVLAPSIAKASTITSNGKTITLKAGSLERTLRIENGDLKAKSFLVGGTPILETPVDDQVESAFTVYRAKPDREPQGLEPGNEGHSWSEVDFAKRLLEGGNDPTAKQQEVRWIKAQSVKTNKWSQLFEQVKSRITHPSEGVTRLHVRARSTSGTFKGLECTLIYDVYDGHPAVRKRIRFANHGKHWLKVDHLLIEALRLKSTFRHRTNLAPSERQNHSSVIALGTEDGSRGVIAGSEIPSALRGMHSDGRLGYRRPLFEWVLGPGEQFTSEPVFYYAYSGETRNTPSAVSTARDRTVEGPYKSFLRQHVGVEATGRPVYAPQWNSWINIKRNMNSDILREQADIASRAGFELFMIDLGWQEYAGMSVDEKRLPHFQQTTHRIRSKGLKLGLWVSVYRKNGSKDLQNMPDARAVPLRVKGNIGFGSFGMSLTSRWRNNYTRDLIKLHKKYGAEYFKQDFSNIKYGDIGKGHEARTRKESLLRGFRALFSVQEQLHQKAPSVHAELTHEIYWGTPGAPADLAVLKHAVQYHIPPNDYSGAIKANRLYSPDWNTDPKTHRRKLIRGAWNARQRFYAHRGLTLRGIEYFASVTINHKGSMTRNVQDRQICSWLMGAPMVFSGDLSSLSEKNITHYRRRFRLLERLQDEYGIYHHFQYSGVPAPTDQKWHWWGKLNDEGHGAVIVMRGSGGKKTRTINIPWVQPDQQYVVTARFSGQPLGTFTGRALRTGAIELSLSEYDQELLEVSSP